MAVPIEGAPFCPTSGAENATESGASIFVGEGLAEIGGASAGGDSGSYRGSPQTVQNFEALENCVPHLVQKTVFSVVMAFAPRFPA